MQKLHTALNTSAHALNLMRGYTSRALDMNVEKRKKMLENELRRLIQFWPIRLGEIQQQLTSNMDGNSYRVMAIIKELLLLDAYSMGRLSWEDFLSNSFNPEESTPLNYLDDSGEQSLNLNSFLYVLLVLQNRDELDLTMMLSNVDDETLNHLERGYVKVFNKRAKTEKHVDEQFGSVKVARGKKSRKHIKSKKQRKSRKHIKSKK